MTHIPFIPMQNTETRRQKPTRIEGAPTLNQVLASLNISHRPTGSCRHIYERNGEIVFVGTVNECWQWLAEVSQ